MSIELEKAPQEIFPMGGVEQSGAIDMLEARWAEGKFLCVGLDLIADEEGTLFEKAAIVVEATKDIAAAFKPNSAFYERRGDEGVAELEKLVAYIKELSPGVPVIWDAKRADIANTNEGYADARDGMLADAMTIHPYLGGKTLEPLLSDPSKLGIVLAHTSNPGADEFQHLRLQNGRVLWEQVAHNVAHDERWKHGSPRGIVMGATYPEYIGRARHIIGNDVVILIPGIGKQGGDLEASVRDAMNAKSGGFLISVSSGISQARDEFGKVTFESIRSESLRYHEQVKAVWQDARDNPKPNYSERQALEFNARFVGALIASECLQFGEFTLRSGMISPYYLDLRNLISDPTIRTDVTNIYVDMIRDIERERGEQFDVLAGIPQASTSFGALVADRMERRLVQPRSGGKKDHGTGKLVEGVFKKGETVGLIDDLITDGGSKIDTLEQLEEVGLIVRGVAMLVDREQGGVERIKSLIGSGVRVATTSSAIIDALISSGLVDNKTTQKIVEYIAAQKK